MLARLLKRSAAYQSGLVQFPNGYVNSLGMIGRYPLDSTAGVYVTEENSLGIPALWRGISMISDAIGGLPLHAYRDTEMVTPTPPILSRPNPPETRVETISGMVVSLIVYGNYFAVLGEPGYNGYPDMFHPVNPARVKANYKDGQLTYMIDDRSYSRQEIMHIKNFALPGEIFGRGIISSQRTGLGIQIAMQNYAANYFNGGTVPSVKIKSDNPDLTQEEADALKLAWLRQYGSGSREPVVFNASTDAEVMNDNAQESQLIEQRTFGIIEAANMLGIPSSYLGATNSSRTYANVEQENLQFVRWTLQPLISRIEQSLSDYIPRGQIARFNIDGLLRSDTLTRYQAHQIALQNGFMTIDEVRAHEYRDPLNNVEDQPEIYQTGVTESDV